MTLSGKERVKKHREKRNRDPTRREEDLKKDRERKQRKKSKMTSKQKEEHRERNRLNVQRHRAKKRVIDDFQDAGAVNLDHPSQSCPKKNRLQPATTGGELSKFLKPDEDGVRIAADKCETDTLQGTLSNIGKFMMTKLEDFHEIMKKILGETSFANADESEIQEALEKTFHHVPDWNGGRRSRKGKNQCDAEKIDTLMKDSKFREAIPLLETHPVTEVQQMKLLECYIEVGEDTKISAVVENMIKLMTQNPHRKANDVSDFGVEYRRSGSYMKAITFFACAGKMYLLESDANEIVRGIDRCSDDCSYAISLMIEQNERMRDLARSVVKKILIEFVDDVMSVENADPDEKVECAVWCLQCTGLCYKDLGNYDEAKECCKRGIDIMNKHFGSNSSKYEIFGLLHTSMGDALSMLGKASRAKILYKQAINAFKQAEDLSDDDRKSIIKEVRRAQMK